MSLKRTCGKVSCVQSAKNIMTPLIPLTHFFTIEIARCGEECNSWGLYIILTFYSSSVVATPLSWQWILHFSPKTRERERVEIRFEVQEMLHHSGFPSFHLWNSGLWFAIAVQWVPHQLYKMTQQNRGPNSSIELGYQNCPIKSDFRVVSIYLLKSTATKMYYKA